MINTKKYFLWILGCAMNYSDAERIASVFDDAGYQPAKTETEADVAVVVACSVRQTAIDRIYGKTKDWNKRKRKDPNFKTFLSGCVLPGDKKKLEKCFELIFDINDISILREYLKNINEPLTSNLKPLTYEKNYFAINPKYENSFRAYVPIMTGCNNFCSYCAVPYTRGREKSRLAKEIVTEIKDLISNGYKEITLLGQNVNSYKYSFTELLKNIDAIPGDYRVYFYSNHPKDMSKELIALLPNLKHFPHYLHLPMQSGDDGILKKMNRHYTAGQYLDLVKNIRQVIPDVVLTTDIIVGFPGESDKEFNRTVDIIKKVGFEMIFVGQYSPRPGTVSAKMDDNVSRAVKKERDRLITDTLRKNLERVNKKFVGKTEKVLIDEKKSGKYYGRTEGYKVVEIKTDQLLEIGRFYDVKIFSSGAWKLSGNIIQVG